MELYLKAAKREHLICPKCGSRRIVGGEPENCHCGQCGAPLRVQMPSEEWQRKAETPQAKPAAAQSAERAAQKPAETAETPAALSASSGEDAAPSGETAAPADAPQPDAPAWPDEASFAELEDAGMIFRPDLEEAQWESEPVYEQLSLFPEDDGA